MGRALPKPGLKPKLPPSRRGEARAAMVFLLPWIVGIVALTAVPMLASLVLSFTNYDLLSWPDWVGTRNYERLFTRDRRFVQALEVTTIYVAVSVPLAVAFALIVAVTISGHSRSSNFFRGVFYLPSLLGGSVAIGVLWRQIFGADGIFTNLLQLLGFQVTSWVGNPDTALTTLILLNIWQFGSPMVIFLAGVRQIPSDIVQAAIMDGASPIRRFFSITLPLLSPLILFNLVMQMIVSFQAFVPAFVIGDGAGGPVDSTLFYTLYLYIEGFKNFRMGYAMAMAWILLGIIAAATAMAFWSSRRWVHYES